MDTSTLQQKEQIAQFVWTGFIVGFFVIQAIIWTVAITITSNDLSHAVVAGYDEQALKWDDVKQDLIDSSALGWTAEIQIDSASNPRGNRVINVCLSDRDDLPIENAVVKLRAFHRGRAADVQELSLLSVGPGVYSGNLNVQRSGIWVFSGTATQGEHQFLIEKKFRVTTNKGG